jgi:peptidoglycan/LPS O-acetylase OafA/YrhL
MALRNIDRSATWIKWLTRYIMDEPELFGLTSLGSIAVYTFFAISGFLITQSFERRKSTVEYARKRFFRIYLGLSICLIFTVYLCCAFFGKMGFVGG